MTSSALRASSPKGEDSALGILCAKGLLADTKWLVQRASPLGEVGGVSFVRADAISTLLIWQTDWKSLFENPRDSEGNYE